MAISAPRSPWKLIDTSGIPYTIIRSTCRALAGVANIGLGPDGEWAAKRMVSSNTRAMSVHFDIDLVTPDALAPTTADAEIRRWWQSAVDTRVAEFLKS